jgi:hypothetical protein
MPGTPKPETHVTACGGLACGARFTGPTTEDVWRQLDEHIQLVHGPKGGRGRLAPRSSVRAIRAAPQRQRPGSVWGWTS